MILISTVLKIYFILINIIAFIVRGVDKWKAENQKRRVKEKTLLTLTGMGGWVGAIIGMTVFHHKTIKGKFLRRFMLIALGWLVLSLVAMYFFSY